MNEKGVTLVELMAVIGIVAVLGAMATIGFRTMQRKGRVEGETKKVYADLQGLRSEALLRKTVRSVKVASGKQLVVYPTKNGTGTALRTISYGESLTSDNDTAALGFDQDGVALQERAYCLGAAGNDASVDSIVVKTTSIRFGKLNGGTCSSANITPK